MDTRSPFSPLHKVSLHKAASVWWNVDWNDVKKLRAQYVVETSQDLNNRETVEICGLPKSLKIYSAYVLRKMNFRYLGLLRDWALELNVTRCECTGLSRATVYIPRHLSFLLRYQCDFRCSKWRVIQLSVKSKQQRCQRCQVFVWES